MTPRIKKAIEENKDLRRVADFGECASIKIPMPISVNAMYRNVPRVGRVKTKELKAWKLEAEWELARQKPPRFIGPVDISITLRYPPKGRADCSNYIKGVEDLLVTCGVIEDDSCKYVRSVSARCRRRDADRVRSPKGFRTQKSRHGVDLDFVDIPQSVAVRREQYVNAPHRSPGDAMLGCPPVGFSALDRKLQGAGA